MRKAFAALFLVAMGVALSGCAVAPRTAGRDFSKEAFASFTLKQTTPEIVQAMIGPPLRQSTVRGTVTNPRATLPVGTPFSLTVYTYSFAVANGGGAAARHPAVKVATLVFYNGTLAAYDVNSTIPGDESAGFDEAKIGSLQRGATTRAEVIALFGPPTGQSIKLDNVPGQSGTIAYGRIEFQGSDIHRRTLRVLLDDHDLMTSYTMLDNTMPANTPMLPPVYRGLVPQAPPPPLGNHSSAGPWAGTFVDGPGQPGGGQRRAAREVSTPLSLGAERCAYAARCAWNKAGRIRLRLQHGSAGATENSGGRTL